MSEIYLITELSEYVSFASVLWRPSPSLLLAPLADVKSASFRGDPFFLLMKDFLLAFLTLPFLNDNLGTAAAAKSLQSCPTLCDPIDGSPPGSPVPGILQARTLEWVAISFSNA